MATTPTNLPIPSEDPRDLKFNAGKFDEVVTSDDHYYTDRFGVQRFTIAGIAYTAAQAVSQFGYITIDSFEDGATITLPNQVLRYEATGEYYRWDGVFPPGGKVIPAGSTPATSGGVGVGAWVSVGDASLRSDLASSSNGKGASLVRLNNGDTVQAALNKVSGSVNVQSFYSGSGFYNNAVLAAAAAGTQVFLGGDVNLDPSTLLDLSAFPNRRYYGGRFVNGNILIRGTVAPAIAMSTPVAMGQKNFTLANGFSAGDLLLIKNFPSNSNDTYTSGPASLFRPGARTYAVSGPGTLRDTRRMQLFDVSVASGTAFSTYQAAVDDMSANVLTVQKVNAVSGVEFACDFKGGTLWCELTDGLKITGNFQDTFLNNATCIRSLIKPASFKSTSDARIDCFDSCTGFRIEGVMSGHTSSADNSMIKILGCQTFDVDVVLTGTNVATGFAHGVMVDTIYEENPSGYPALPSKDYSIRATVSGISSEVNGSHAVSIVSDPYRAKNINALVIVNSASGTVHLKGAEAITVNGVANIISMEGSRYCDVDGLFRNDDYMSNWTSPYGAVNNMGHIGIYYSNTTDTTVTGESSAGTATITASQCTFIRKGREVRFNLIIAYTALTGAGNLVVTVPTIWACKAGLIHNFSAQVSGQNSIFAQIVDGTRSIRFQRNDTTYVQCADVTAGTIRIAGTYTADYVQL